MLCKFLLTSGYDVPRSRNWGKQALVGGFVFTWEGVWLCFTFALAVGARGFCFLHCRFWAPMFSFSLSKIKSFSDKLVLLLLQLISALFQWSPAGMVGRCSGKMDSMTSSMIKSQSLGFPSGADGKESSAFNVGGMDSIPGLGRSPGEVTGYPLQSSCLENSMDRGVWWATVCGVAKSQIRLSNWAWAMIETEEG